MTSFVLKKPMDMSLKFVVGGAILVTVLAILIKSCRRISALHANLEILCGRVDTLHTNLEILQKLVEGTNKADGVTLPVHGRTGSKGNAAR